MTAKHSVFVITLHPGGVTVLADDTFLDAIASLDLG